MIWNTLKNKKVELITNNMWNKDWNNKLYKEENYRIKRSKRSFKEELWNRNQIFFWMYQNLSLEIEGI